MPTMSETNTIKAFKNVFARHGYPAHLVTDNYSTFVGGEFQQFMKENGIRHSTTPTYFPATNGAAENFVDTFKRKIKCIMDDGISFEDAVVRFLFDYRSTPHAATQKTPASLALGRELKTRFSLLRPPTTNERMITHQTRQIQNYPGRKQAQFEVNDPVMVKKYSQGGKESWIAGIVNKALVPGVTYEIKVDGQKLWKRHANQMIKCEATILQRPLEADKEGVQPIAPRRSERLRNKKGEV